MKKNFSCCRGIGECNSSAKTKSMRFLLATIVVLIGAGRAASQTPDSLTKFPPAVMATDGDMSNSVSQWVDRTPRQAAAPAASEDCAMVYDPVGHRIVLFGGKGNDNKTVNEIWALDLKDNRWHKIEVQGETPPPSEDHVAVYDPLGHRMVLHGGENGLTRNYTWSFDLSKYRWRDLTSAEAPAREDHTAIYDSRSKRMVIFGGRDKDSTFDHINIYEIWALDLDPISPAFEQWRNLTVEYKHPAGRSDHVAIYDARKNRMIIYGGWDKEKKECLGDTWAFHFANDSSVPGFWKQIKTKKSHPPKRRHAAGVYDSARNWFIVCGGFGEEGYFNDVWAFDLTDDFWINITPGPPPRMDHQAIFDPISHNVLLWGGDGGFKTMLRDLWELQIQRLTIFNAFMEGTDDKPDEKK